VVQRFEGTRIADFDEGDFENLGTELAELGRERAGLMAGTADEDAEAG
jgi:hypothetical protein